MGLKLEVIIQNIKALGKRKIIALSATTLLILTILGFGLSMVTSPVYSNLYTGLEASEAAGVVKSLEQSGIDVKLSSDGSVVSIPSGQFARARMALAENGLPSAGSPGWELFDNTGNTINSEQQKVNKLRAIQGELSRTITTIDGIHDARVHVVLPEREAFSREAPTPTASVLIRTAPSFVFEKKNAIAIRALVSSSVQNLAASKVTIMTADGAILLSEENENNNEASMDAQKYSRQQNLKKSIKNILGARVGAENVKVTVSVDLSRERKVTVSESFDPDQQVARSIDTLSETEERRDSTNQNVSVDNNLPESIEGPTNSGAGSNRQKTGETINFEIGSTKSEIIQEPGEVERISVAVAINGIYQEVDGETVYEDRSSLEIEQLKQLVEAAIGFKEVRGDTVSVQSFQFKESSFDLSFDDNNGLLRFFENNAMTLIKWILVSFILMMILLLGIKPIVRTIMPNTVEAEDDAEDTSINTDEDESNDVKPNILEVIDASSKEEDEFIDINSVKGGVRKRRVAVVIDMVKQDKPEAVKILKSWASEGFV